MVPILIRIEVCLGVVSNREVEDDIEVFKLEDWLNMEKEAWFILGIDQLKEVIMVNNYMFYRKKDQL